ncbi:MAG TPA: DUF6356 family protein [Sphingomicrobium sp.]|nr:DUF6356 family protein [Sphingomicrobium sp.]
MAVEQQDAEIGGRSSLVGKLFVDHPRSLGMSWATHGAGAVVIGARLIGAGFACLVHALVPALFTQTAGRTVTSMHDDIVRRKAGSANPNAWPDYEI